MTDRIRIRITVRLAPHEAEALTLAADVRAHRAYEALRTLGQHRGVAPNTSETVAERLVPGLARDVAAWATDPTLPADLRERAAALSNNIGETP